MLHIILLNNFPVVSTEDIIVILLEKEAARPSCVVRDTLHVRKQYYQLARCQYSSPVVFYLCAVEIPNTRQRGERVIK